MSSPKYSVVQTSEEGLRQRDEFYSRHDDASGWQHYAWNMSEGQKDRLLTRWIKLINLQNGRDLDDYVLRPGANKIEKIFLPLAGNNINSRILILGTGPGREVALLKNYGYTHVRGVTLGPRNVRFAQEIVGLEEEAIIFDDIHLLPLEDRSIDVVAGFQMLEHTPSPLLLLIECNRILVPNGTLILEIPPATIFTGGAELHHILCPIPIQTRGLLVKAGFANISFFMRGDGQRQVNYQALDPQPLDSIAETRADIEYIVTASKDRDPLS